MPCSYGPDFPCHSFVHPNSWGTAIPLSARGSPSPGKPHTVILQGSLQTVISFNTVVSFPQSSVSSNGAGYGGPPFPHFFSSRLSWRSAQGNGKGTSAAACTRGCPSHRHRAPPPAGGGQEPGRGRGLSSKAPVGRGWPASGAPTRRRSGPLRPEIWAGSDAGAKGEPTYALLPLAAKTATNVGDRASVSLRFRPLEQEPEIRLPRVT